MPDAGLKVSVLFLFLCVPLGIFNPPELSLTTEASAKVVAEVGFVSFVVKKIFSTNLPAEKQGDTKVFTKVHKGFLFNGYNPFLASASPHCFATVAVNPVGIQLRILNAEVKIRIIDVKT